MINSADTSVHITAELRKRWREGGTESERKGHVVKKQISVRGTSGDSKLEREGGRQGKNYGWRESMESSMVAGQRQEGKEFGLRGGLYV